MVVKVMPLWLSNTGRCVIVAVFNNDTVVLRGTVALLEKSCEKKNCSPLSARLHSDGI